MAYFGGTHPKFDRRLQTEQNLGKCFGITQVEQDVFAGRLVFCWDAPPKPVHLDLSAVQWHQIYTILYHHASGSNTDYDKWISIQGLDDLLYETFAIRLEDLNLQVDNDIDLAAKFDPVCHRYRDEMAVYLRVVPTGGVPRNIESPASDWAIQQIASCDPDWRVAIEQLKTNFKMVLGSPQYLRDNLMTLFELFPGATTEWTAEVRANVYALCLCHFPTGLDWSYLLPAYKRMFNHDLATDLNIPCTKELLVGHVVPDFIKLIPSSRVYGTAYINYFANVTVPSLILDKMGMRLEGDQMFMNRDSALVMANTLY